MSTNTPAKTTAKDSLFKIEVYPIPAFRVGNDKSRIPKTKQGAVRDVIITLPNVNQGFRSTPVSVKYSELKSDPLGYLRKYPGLALYTNATKEQLDKIKKLTRRELFELKNS